MQKNSVSSFLYTLGICHLMQQFIVLTEDGDVNKVLRRKEKNSYPRYIKLAGLLYALLIIAGVYALLQNRGDIFTICALATIPCLLIILRLRNKSNTRVIQRKHIRHIQLKKIRSNPTFVILFKDDKNKMRERHLPMKAEDIQELDKALRILRGANLMSHTSINQQSAYQLMQDDEIKSAKGSSSSEYQTAPKKMDAKKETTYKRNASGYLKDY